MSIEVQRAVAVECGVAAKAAGTEQSREQQSADESSERREQCRRERGQATIHGSQQQSKVRRRPVPRSPPRCDAAQHRLTAQRAGVAPTRLWS